MTHRVLFSAANYQYFTLPVHELPFLGKLTKCQKDAEKASRGSEGAFVPECDKNGAYMKIQCHKEYCWCVSENGKELEGTRTGFGNPICEKGILGRKFSIHFIFSINS